MSYEYIVELPQNDVKHVKETLVRKLRENPLYRLSCVTEREIIVKYSKRVEINGWQDDIEIIFQEETLLIAMHIGTREERASIYICIYLN